MENRTRSAKLMNITAMAAFGTLGYFVAKIPLASEEIAFFRAVIAAVVILAWQLVRGRKFRLCRCARHRCEPLRRDYLQHRRTEPRRTGCRLSAE